MGKYLKSKGILPALAAHTDAIYEEVLEAFENDYTLVTLTCIQVCPELAAEMPSGMQV